MAEPPPWTPRDPLGDVLHRLRMRGTFYCRSELTEPWALEIPALPDTVSFHVITQGTAVLEVPGSEAVELRPGDLALVPRGAGHRIASAAGVGPAGRVDLLDQEYVTEHYSLLRHGGGGRPALLLCGVVSFEDPVAREMVRLLPPVLPVVAAASTGPTSIHDTVRMMAAELAEPRLGGEAVTTRLADIVVVQIVRGWLEQDPTARRGWLGALQDANLGPALAAVHADPGRPWTLAGLAREAAMSRTSFAERFRDVVGEPPMAYLTRWRMNLAHTRLADGAASVDRVAAELGYGSAAAFTRAFVRVVGETPGAVRRRAADGRRRSQPVADLPTRRISSRS